MFTEQFNQKNSAISTIFRNTKLSAVEFVDNIASLPNIFLIESIRDYFFLCSTRNIANTLPVATSYNILAGLVD